MIKNLKFILPFIVLVSLAMFGQNCTETIGDAPTNNVSQGGPQLNRTDFLTGLSSPWDLAFTPDGAMFFTEKCRGLSVRRSNGDIARLFGTAGSALQAPDMFCQGQSGVHGVALDPNFASNRTLYVYMASTLSNPRTNRVVRLVTDSGYTTVSNRTDIVTDIPFKNDGNSWGGAGSHSGGRIRFGPDGFLYITTGDNHNGPLPQDLSRLGGKVLRVDRDGNAAAGNNTPTGGDPRIFTYGHRNVQGIDFHPTAGQAFVAEHGPNHSDEVTALIAGGNGGWDPAPEAGVTCADNYCGYVSNKPDGTLTPMTDTEKFPQALRPSLRLEDSKGIGPLTFLTGDNWKDWNGRVAVGLMAERRVEVYRVQGLQLVDVVSLDLPLERPRSMVVAPDGNLYVATDSGSIWRIQPQ